MAREVSTETKVRRMCEGVPGRNMVQARELAQNILFMAEKLDKARKFIANSNVVIPYSNGGGQTGVRANPAYSSYTSLMRAYTAAVRQLESMREEDEGGLGWL